MVYRPKDPYQNRPLPYLIGSKEWQEKWHIGLVESENEESSGKEEDDEMSESSNDALHDVDDDVPSLSSQPSIAQTTESENSVWGVH